MIMKTISMMPESQRRAAMKRFAELCSEGHAIEEIAKEMNIPESEIRTCVEWVHGFDINEEA